MPYKRIYVFLEGTDDERFFERVIRPIFERTYNYVKSWQYANQKREKVERFLSSIKSMGADYFFCADINSSPCVTAKKEAIAADYRDCFDKNKVIVVVREIEGWYLAGLDEQNSQDIGIEAFNQTNDIAKEQFNEIRPSGYESRIDFMIGMLNRFSIETAKEKNKSFCYFMSKVQQLS